MTIDSTTALPVATILSQAAASFRGDVGDRPKARTVISALLQAEKAAKQQRLTYPLESLLGRWQLCFTATRTHQRGETVLGRGWYVPKVARAHISFNVNSMDQTDREIGNQLQLGPLLLQITGPFQYLGEKNLLAFDFTELRLCLFAHAVYQGNFRGGKAQAEDFCNQSIAKLPFFTFFLADEEFIAARGRGGGLALWVRDSG